MSTQGVMISADPRESRTAIVRLAWPIFLEQILVSLVQAADSAMVGSLGAAATASVAINTSPYSLINGLIMVMGVGFTSLIARSIGAKKSERARHLTKQAIMTVVAMGIPLSVLSYACARILPMWMGGQPEILDNAEIYNQILSFSMMFRCMTMMLTAIFRGYGDSKTPMIINTIVNIMNVTGNFLMIYPSREIFLFGKAMPIFGFGWGVAGAAISTSVSGTFGGIALLMICFFRKSDMQLSFKGGFKPDWKELSVVIRISFPAMLERFIMGTAFIVVGKTVASLGTVAIAAMNLSGTAESLSFMPGFAFSASTTTIFAQSLGAKREDAARRCVSETKKMGSWVMLLTSLILFFASAQIMRVFTPDQQVIEMGSTLLKIVAVIQIPQMISSVYSGALKGAGDSRSPFLIALISMWGIRLAGAVFCVHVLHLGIESVCVCMCLDNVVRCTLFHFRFRQEKWKEKQNED